MKNYLCIDIGGSFIKYAVTNEQYNINYLEKINTPSNINEFVESLKNIYLKCNRKYQLSGIAFSIPGRINCENNSIISAGCVTYLKDFDLHGYMSDMAKVSVSMENDAVCAALAELECGALRGCQDALAVIFGTGIGGAIIRDGKIYKGTHNAAAELSFIIMGAGFYNEETLWSADIGDYNLRNLVSGIKNIPFENLDGVKIFDMAENNDEEVNIIISNYTRLIARNLFNLQAVLDVEKIAIGGGISARKLFVDGIKDGIESYASMIESPVVMPEIVRCAYAGEANLIGALVHHLQKNKSKV